MKLTASVNVINILRWPFLYKSVLHSFSLVTVWLCNYLEQEYWNIGAKAAHNMLIKLTTGQLVFICKVPIFIFSFDPKFS